MGGDAGGSDGSVGGSGGTNWAGSPVGVGERSRENLEVEGAPATVDDLDLLPDMVDNSVLVLFTFTELGDGGWSRDSDDGVTGIESFSPFIMGFGGGGRSVGGFTVATLRDRARPTTTSANDAAIVDTEYPGVKLSVGLREGAGMPA